MKKRLLAFLLSAFLMFGLLMQFPVSAQAAASSGTWGGIDWTLSEDGTLTIAPTKGTPVPDPNSGKTFPVGAWREAVIYNSSGVGINMGGTPYNMNAVKSLIIEEGVTSIGSFAAQFPNLTGEVVIPSTVTYIGQEAFQKAPITQLTFAPGGTGSLCIAPGAFKSLKIQELILPVDRPEIHLHCWAFVDCLELETTYLPDNVTLSGWVHVEYNGMNNYHPNPSYRNTSELFTRCSKIDTMVFGSEAVLERFLAGRGNASVANRTGVEIHIHNCQQSNWIRDEIAHHKTECVLYGCPLERNLRVFDQGAHAFGADDTCTTCGYLRDTENTAAPETGDTTHTLLWATLFFGGVAMMWMQLNARKRDMF